MEKLTLEKIAELSDQEVLALSIPRPSDPKQIGFMFSLSNFESKEEMAKCMFVLTKRLSKIKK